MRTLETIASCFDQEGIHRPNWEEYINPVMFEMERAQTKLIFRTYFGPSIEINHKIIQSGMKIAALHMDNHTETLLNQTPNKRIGRMMLDLMIGLHVSANMIQQGKLPHDFSALYGISHLVNPHTKPFLEAAHFTVNPHPTIAEKTTATISGTFYRNAGNIGEETNSIDMLSFLQKRIVAPYASIWMTKKTFMHNYCEPEKYAQTVNGIIGTFHNAAILPKST